MIYTDDNRGKIQNRGGKQQIIDFSKIRYGNSTPTDIDGMIEKGNEVFVFYELKHGASDMPGGQRIAMTRLCDALRAANKRAVLFLCRHDVHDVNQDIDAASAIVTSIYFNGEWHPGRGRKLKEASDSFMRWAMPFV